MKQATKAGDQVEYKGVCYVVHAVDVNAETVCSGCAFQHNESDCLSIEASCSSKKEYGWNFFVFKPSINGEGSV